MSKIKNIFPTLVLTILYVLSLTGIWIIAGQFFGGNTGFKIDLFGFDVPIISLVFIYILILISAVFYSLIVLLGNSLFWILIGPLLALIFSVPILFARYTTYIIVLLPALGILMFCAWRMKEIMRDLVPWKPSWALHAGLPIYFFALNIVFTAIITLSPMAGTFFKQPVPYSAVNTTLSVIAGPIQKFVGIDINGSVDSAINAANDGKIKDPRLLAQAREEYSKSFGFKLSGDEKIKDIIFRLVDREVSRVRDQIGKILIVIFAVSSFFTFQFLVWPAKIAADFLVRFLLFIFGTFGLIVIESRPATKYTARWRSTPPQA